LGVSEGEEESINLRWELLGKTFRRPASRAIDACPKVWWFGPHTTVKTGSIIGIGGAFGREYTVRAGNLGNEGTVDSEHIKLVAPKPVAIVALIEDGQPKPSASPHVHRTTAGAKTEAERLSKLHVGKQFGVYELIATHTHTPTAYKHEWQRKAKEGQRIEAIKLLRQAADIGLKSAKDAVEDWLLRN
jgi:hypothetical protein